MKFKADIRRVESSTRKALLCVWILLAAVTVLIGLYITEGKYFYESPDAIASFILIPFIILGMQNAWCKRLSLTLHDDRVTGTYGKFSTKSLSLPIEQLSSVSVIDSFGDKLRSGKTLSIRSASGVVAIPFVQNADEFAEKALEAISKYKEDKRPSSVSNPAQTVVNPTSADELKKYKELLDSGVITQEEFDAKKKQLLGL